MKILLTTLNSKYIHTCLSIKYLYEFIKDECNCFMKEFTINENMDKIFSEIISGDYDIVAFSCYIWNIELTLKLSETIKQANPKIKILLGGPEVTYDSVEVMKNNDFIDYIIEGEGEITLFETIKALKDNENMNIDGLTYRENQNKNNKTSYDKNSQIIKNTPRDQISDLSIIKSPYTSTMKSELENKIAYYETSRGCTYNCEYCLSSTIKGVRFFPENQIYSDLKKLVSMEVKQIKFVDRTFNSHKERTLKLVKYLKEIDNGKINFHFEITAHMLQDDLLEEFRTSREGLFQFEIGVQSTNEKTIKAVNRIDNFKVLSEKVIMIKKFKNIHQHLDLIAGLPYENLDRFKISFNDVFRLNPEMIQLGFLKLLKGSPLLEKAELYGYKYRKYPPYEVISSDYITPKELIFLKEIEDIVEKFYNSGLFIKSIWYLYENHYLNNPFQLFEDINIFLKSKKIHENLSKDALYEVMYDFYKDKNFQDLPFFNDLLKFDFLRLGRARNVPSYLRNERELFSREDSHIVLSDEKLKERLGYKKDTHPLEIIKNGHLEIFRYNIDMYLENKEQKLQSNYFIYFDYTGKKDFNSKVRFFGGNYEK